MPKTLSQVAQDAAELPASDRLKLARLMLDLTDLESASPDQVQSEWDEEIQRRLEELRSGQVTGVPLEEVKKRVEARFRS
jgi:putative addiction module component (TIGR02574 family)